MNKVYSSLVALCIVLLTGCASYQTQIASGVQQQDSSNSKSIEKTLYLIGDAGALETQSEIHQLNPLVNFFADRDTRKDHLIFLGDNVYEKGIPSKDDTGYELAKDRLSRQLELAQGFEGTTVFIPGNHDWYSGLKGLKRQEEMVEKALGKNSFQPEKGCPVEKIDLTDNVVLLVIDTEWYLTNWDAHPTMNDNCEIKTRNDYILEIEGELKKNNEKTIVLALHHPAITYGPHGGHFGVRSQLFPFQDNIPLPGIATLISQFRAQGGVSPQDRFNSRYNELMRKLTTLARGNDRLILVSGHEHSLQYNDEEGIKQIVSGSGSKTSAVALGKDAQFVSAESGFAKLQVFTDGSSEVIFYGITDGQIRQLFATEVHPPTATYDVSDLPTSFNTETKATAYDKSTTEKSDGYRWFWGDHYRYVYGTDIKVPVATLDTLYGGFTIERKGGGHQTRSLRLLDRNGRNFALRGVKKSATRYLQSVLFTDTYVEEDFEETTTEDVILDFYTASHPYATFVVGPLADAVGVYHTNPFLFYMPKHAALGKYNAEFGNELYVIEERPDDDFLDVVSFGKPDAIESTSDLMKNLRKDEKYQVDQSAFIKARLFDMLLGDWDRHQDQWRWSRFDISEDQKVYRPIPRDRDQVFSFYDGALLDIVRVLIPSAKQLQKYGEEIDDLKWLNAAGIKLDRSFLQTATKADWEREAAFIRDQLTDAVLKEAFEALPVEVQDETSETIKVKLKQRRDDLVAVAGRYYEYLSRLVVITGTDKDDLFEISRGNGSTKISVSRIKDGKKQAPYKERTIFTSETKEVWIYGLDDDDRFEVKGDGSNPVFIRIIGGQNNDIYDFENGRSVKVHDHKSKPNTIENKGGASFRFADTYEVNTYDYQKLIRRTNSIVPSIAGNPDDGIRIGFLDTYVVEGFKTNPFHQKHQLAAGYYFATEGFDLSYDGEFASIFGDWNLHVNGEFTSENFTRNFFGFGNETVNNQDTEPLELDFNRVKTGTISGRFGAVRNGEYGSRLEISTGIQNIEVENTDGRFIADFFSNDPGQFEAMTFADFQLNYYYGSYDQPANPTRGAMFRLNTGVRTNTEDTDRTYGFLHPAMQFYNALTKDRKLVLRTMAQGQFNLGDNFEFFQAAVIGDGNGLRGYRTQRFSGKSALALGADLRYSFPKFKTGLLPLQIGIFGGADTGRVWIPGEDSNTWHSDVGGGFWINAVDTMSGQFGLFQGDDGLRISFGFGVSL